MLVILSLAPLIETSLITIEDVTLTQGQDTITKEDTMQGPIFSLLIQIETEDHQDIPLHTNRKVGTMI